MAYRQTMLLSKAYAEQVAPVIHGETDGTTPPVGTGYIDAVMMMPTAWNIEKQAFGMGMLWRTVKQCYYPKHMRNR